MWFDICKKGSKSISTHAVNLLTEIMADGEKRTAEEILEAMQIDKPFRNLGKQIPTRGELKHYLAKHYSSGVFHNETGKKLPNMVRNASRKYYR